jgi:hypothetical protein
MSDAINVRLFVKILMRSANPGGARLARNRFAGAQLGAHASQAHRKRIAIAARLDTPRQIAGLTVLGSSWGAI